MRSVQLAKRVGWPVVVFAGSKAAVLCAPLLLIGALPLAAYGALETSLAQATILAPVLAGGMAAAVPYFLLKEQQPDFEESILLYALLLSSLGLLTAHGIATSWGPESALPFLCATLTALQFILSALCKTKGMPARASIIESGVYLVLLGLGSWGLWVAKTLPLQAAYDALATYLAAIVFGVFLSLRFSRAFTRTTLQRLWPLLQFGVPLLLPGLASLLLVSGGRASAAYLLGDEAAGIYGFFFRLTAPAIVVHQLLATVFFRQLYASSAQQLDRYFLAVISGAAVVALLSYWASPLLLPDYFPLLAQIPPERTEAFLAISLHMGLWVGLAVIEPIIVREKLAWSQLRIMLAGVFIPALLGLLAYTNDSLDLLLLCRLQLLAFVLAYAGLIYVLLRAKICLTRTAAVLPLTAWAYAIHVLTTV